MSEKSDIQEIRDAVTVVRTFSADEQMRINAFEREMAMIDHLAEISAAKRDGRLEAEKEYKGKLEDADRKADEAERKAEEAERKAEESKNRADDEKTRADNAENQIRRNVVTMLKDQMPDEMILRYTGITLEKLQEIKDSITQKP